MAENEFDYVVVGGGHRGLRGGLAPLRGPRRVGLPRSRPGPSDVGDDAILDLSRWMELLESGYDWDYPIEPQESGNSYMRHARAKVLGGCSSHNSAIAFWAPRENLDDWAAQRGDGVDRRGVLPLLPQARDRAGHDGGGRGPRAAAPTDR